MNEYHNNYIHSCIKKIMAKLQIAAYENSKMSTFVPLATINLKNGGTILCELTCALIVFVT